MSSSKINDLIKLISSSMSEEDKAELLATKNKSVTALRLDASAPAHQQMVGVIMHITDNLLDHIEGAETGDAMNALMNSMANYFLRDALPGKERNGRDALVDGMAKGLDLICIEMDKFYAAHPDYMAKFSKLMTLIEDDKADEKARLDAIEELKDMKDRRTKSLMKDRDICNSSGTLISEANNDEVDLDYDAATHKTIGHA